MSGPLACALLIDLGMSNASCRGRVDASQPVRADQTVLIIGGDEKTPLPVAASELTLSIKQTKTKEGKVVPPMTVTLLPKDEANGKATTFVGSDPGIGNVADFAGTVLGEVDGKPSQGEFAE